MSQPWFTGSGAGAGSARPRTRTRPNYHPPHARSQPEITVTIPSRYASRGRRQPRRDSPGPLDILQEFDDLEITSQFGEDAKPETKSASAYDDTPVEATGSDIPPPATSFLEIGFSGKALIDNIKRCGYVSPTPIQRYAIPVALAGRDLMACAQTGSGKTAAFCFPIINGVMLDKERSKVFNGNRGGPTRLASPLSLILAPTRELACQIHDEATKFSYQTGVRVVAVYGGAPIVQQRLASDFLSNYIFLAAGKVGSSTDLIVQRVEFVADVDKRNYLVDILRRQKTNSTPAKDVLTLVFVETKRGADALVRWLSMKGFPATVIHGDKVQMERENALKSFRSGRTPILVATDVAARGLDIPHVAHVINFDLPRAIDDYVHRIGRTGRAGKSGMATAFFSEKNIPLAKSLIQLMLEAKQEVPSWLNEYAETAQDNYYNGSGRKYGGRKSAAGRANNGPSYEEDSGWANNGPAYEEDPYAGADPPAAVNFSNFDTSYGAAGSYNNETTWGTSGGWE
ncbi:ATP-dependent RNA helicase DED1 [Striga asiatica]|uniref:RNA helicase n=1 Tax=Striga asiatica TaxID=4170 RepID=A0A5A7PWK8_STRAF|nr:ATP-dependent RNA helicase DED1 [Striga asiatica]